MLTSSKQQPTHGFGGHHRPFRPCPRGYLVRLWSTGAGNAAVENGSSYQKPAIVRDAFTDITTAPHRPGDDSLCERRSALRERMKSSPAGLFELSQDFGDRKQDGR